MLDAQLEVRSRWITVDGIRLFYREAGDAAAPVLLLLHGYPSSSHMFRTLMPKLAHRFRVIAPDYPGAGYSDAPDSFVATFDALADVVDGFLRALHIERFSLYIQDFGGPVGMRIATRRPERIERLIIQNANTYLEGIAPNVRADIERRATQPSREDEMAFELGPDLPHVLYKVGARDPESMSPDSWTHDAWALAQPGHRRIAIALLNDYPSNLALYPAWQAYLRAHQPPTLIAWGKGDPVFLVEGAEAYRRDVPGAVIRYFDTSHFALEEDAAGIAAEILAFAGDA